MKQKKGKTGNKKSVYTVYIGSALCNIADCNYDTKNKYLETYIKYVICLSKM